MTGPSGEFGGESTFSKNREFVFSSEDFYALRELARESTGISLSEEKRELVYGRVSRRLRVLGLRSFADYRQLLESRDADEMVEFCHAITTNLTYYFRESHHFDYLRERILRPWLKTSGAARRLRIWSSACSSGEEAYSIAMTVCEVIPDWRRWDIKILATDVDSNVLERAQAGSYAPDRMRGLTARQVADHFLDRRRMEPACFKVSPDLAGLITFRRLNLTRPLPMSGPFDVIFCRNVIIYFDKATQRGLFARMCRLQRPGDHLFLGHSESLIGVSDEYTHIGKTMYVRS